MNNIKQEIIVMLAILTISYLFFSHFDVLEKIVEWSRKHEKYEIDEILSSSIVLVLLLFVFAVRRCIQAHRLSQKLQASLDEIKTLRGIIPICSYCKKIRDEKGSWTQLEAYIHSHSHAEFSHGVCPECYEKKIKEMDLD